MSRPSQNLGEGPELDQPRQSSSPWNPAQDSNAGVGTSFGDLVDDATDRDLLADFTDSALAADQLPTSGHDQAPQPAPSRYTYPFIRGPRGRLAD